MHHTVVVESPAKAKTINKYLGNDYTVLASFGHVRDLPSKDGSVEPDNDFAMHYQIDDSSKKHMSAIISALKGADTLYLATDPDREGEAISWHVVEALQEKKALKPGLKIKRITFHEITKKAVQAAIAQPREIDMDLVNAQQARRALDYLVGFNLSPILWRKLPGARSAGRVQSVALRLVCERDAEIEQFNAQEYWDITAQMQTAKGADFTARLTHWQGEKLEKFSLTKEEQAQEVVQALHGKAFEVATIEQKAQRRNPYPPFTTSTLQMDASRKLGFGAKKTMTLAQKLYEGIDIGGETVGLITYMRTDGVNVSAEAIDVARTLIASRYGKDYLPEKPRHYQSKAKNAQEAHEAIRPTDISRLPEHVARALEPDMLRLYELIWKRMVASQMEPAIYDQVAVTMTSNQVAATLRANGSVLKFDGFLAAYLEGRDEDANEEETRLLPPMTQGEQSKLQLPEAHQHFTEPPPRFSEASLVKRLEELGIGRPSTYASIISVLQDRGYVRLEKKRFIAEMQGRLVNAFLVSQFPRYVEYDFTAELEQELDTVAEGQLDWKSLLTRFWKDFHAQVQSVAGISPMDITKMLDEALASFIFGTPQVDEAQRLCPACSKGQLHLRTGRYGAFLGCTNYPDCNFTRQLGTGDQVDAMPAEAEGAEFPRSLGHHPKTGAEIIMKKGPYGIYVEMEDAQAEATPAKTTKGKPQAPKPKRAGIPKGRNPLDFTLQDAVDALALPRDVGEHPDTGKLIRAGVGRFGPYLQHDGSYVSIPKDDDVYTIGMNRAVVLIAEYAEKKAKKAAEGTTERAKRTPTKKEPTKKTSAKAPKKAATKKTASPKK